MIIRYDEPFSKLYYEGEVIGDPIYKDYTQQICFVIKLKDGTFREVNIEHCHEIQKYSKED